MKTLYTYVAAMLLACASLVSQAQELKTPQLSSTQTIVQELGLGKITLVYSRPNVKSRKIFGNMEPYGVVWRTGANAATTITFTDDVIIEGNKVPAGEYGLFSIPDKDEWTVILNKTANQWGAYTYKQADDILRFKVKTINHADPLETLTMQFNYVDQTKCELELRWENISFSFHISTEVDSKIMASIDDIMNHDKKPYFSAALYYYENNKDLSKALEWISAGEKNSPKSSFYKVWKARIQLKMGDKAGALKTAQEGVLLAKADNDAEYQRLNQAVADQAKK